MYASAAFHSAVCGRGYCDTPTVTSTTNAMTENTVPSLSTYSAVTQHTTTCSDKGRDTVSRVE